MKITMQSDNNGLVWMLDGRPAQGVTDTDKVNKNARNDIDYCRADVEIPRGILFDVEARAAKAQLKPPSGAIQMDFSSTEPVATRWKKGGGGMKKSTKQTKYQWNEDLMSSFSAVPNPFQAEIKRDTGAGGTWESQPCRQVTIIFED